MNKSHLKFSSDTICARYENGIDISAGLEIKHSAELSEVWVTAPTASCLGNGLDPMDELVTCGNVHTGRRIRQPTADTTMLQLLPPFSVFRSIRLVHWNSICEEKVK